MKLPSLKKKKTLSSKTKVLLGAAGLFLFIVGAKRSFSLGTAEKTAPAGEGGGGMHEDVKQSSSLAAASGQLTADSGRAEPQKEPLKVHGDKLENHGAE